MLHVTIQRVVSQRVVAEGNKCKTVHRRGAFLILSYSGYEIQLPR